MASASLATMDADGDGAKDLRMTTSSPSNKTEPPHYNSLLMLTDEQTTTALSVLDAVFYILFVISVPLTLCNVVVFCQKSMRGATSVYVTGLSVAQIIYIVGYAGLLLIQKYEENYSTSKLYWEYFMWVMVYLYSVVRRGSYLVTCLVSAERLYAVVKPLHIQNFVLSKHPLAVMLAAYLLTAVWHVYIPIRSVVIGVKVGSGSVIYFPVRTELYYRHQAVNDGFGMAAKIVLSYIGLGAQIVLNVLTIWVLKRHNVAAMRMRTSSANNGGDDAKRQQERQLTITILAATIGYVVLSLPDAFQGVFHTVYPEYKPTGMYKNLYSVMGAFCFNLTVMSCAVDFICFLALSSNYRKVLFALLAIRRNKTSRLQEITSTTETVVTEKTC